MNKLIRYGTTEKIPYFNCSGKTDDEWYAMGQKRPIFGWSVLIWGIFVEILYFPVIYIMFRTKLTRHSCYKLIVLLGVVDMITTVVSCVISGVLFIKGAVYCNYPTFIYIAGGFAFGGWCCACACTLVLAINRVGDVLFPLLSHHLFDGKRTYYWMMLILTYYFYVEMFTAANTFNSRIGAWIPNPMVIDNPSPEILKIYTNEVQLLNNYTLIIGICSLYTLYCILVNRLEKKLKSKASKQVFIQSTIICFFNTFAAGCYSAFIVIPTPPWVILFGEMCWSGVHSAPAIVYLVMNKTVRKEFFKMLGIWSARNAVGTTSNKQSPGTNGFSESQI